MRPFLTAEWKNLILLTYAVEQEVLYPYLPKGLTLDLRDGRAFVSFVAFDFLNTRVKGLKLPFHVNFPEINLRFYVRHRDKHGVEKRGVVFIKELVPKYCIALVADKIYNEPYEATPMRSNTELNGKNLILQHRLKYGGRIHSCKFTVVNEPYLPKAETTAHFFKEHEWGFGVTKKGKLSQYKVEHPHWKVYPIEKRFELKIDFGVLYGERWSFLNGQIPYNLTIAEGSPIKVFPGQIIADTKTDN